MTAIPGRSRKIEDESGGEREKEASIPGPFKFARCFSGICPLAPIISRNLALAVISAVKRGPGQWGYHEKEQGSILGPGLHVLPSPFFDPDDRGGRSEADSWIESDRYNNPYAGSVHSEPIRRDGIRGWLFHVGEKE